MSAPDVLEVTEQVVGGAAIRIALRGSTTLNVIDEGLMRRAHSKLEEILLRPGLRCLIFTGRDERAFIGGANLHALRALNTANAESFIRSIHEFAATIMRASVPSIAILRGYCLGAGLEIAAACDIRVGDHSVRCGMPEVRVGVPSVIEAALLPQLIGWGKARELLLRGHIIEAEEAARIGLLQHLLDAGSVESCVEDIVRDILAGAPGAVSAQKRLFSVWQDSDTTDAIELGVAAFVSAYASDEPARYIEKFFTERTIKAR